MVGQSPAMPGHGPEKKQPRRGRKMANQSMDKWLDVQLTTLAKEAGSVMEPCLITDADFERNEGLGACGQEQPCGTKEPCGRTDACGLKEPCGIKQPCRIKKYCLVKQPCLITPCGQGPSLGQAQVRAWVKPRSAPRSGPPGKPGSSLGQVLGQALAKAQFRAQVRLPDAAQCQAKRSPKSIKQNPKSAPKWPGGSRILFHLLVDVLNLRRHLICWKYLLDLITTDRNNINNSIH